MIDLADMMSTNRFERDVPLKLYSVGGFVKGMIRVETVKRNVCIDSRIRWEIDPIAASAARVGSNQLLPVEVRVRAKRVVVFVIVLFLTRAHTHR